MANFTKIAGAGAIAALLSATPALAQMAWDDEGWDMDGDGVFSLEEFRQGFRDRINFADWDADGDGLLTEDEFGGAIYSRYDANTTEAFEEEEYGAFERDFGHEGIWGSGVSDVEAVASDGLLDEEDVIGDDEVYAADNEIAGNEALGGIGLEGWDIDGDGVLLRNEFQDGFREWGTFGEFDVDMDGGITEDELTAGIFGRYDDDATGFIEEPELTDIGDDMGDEGFWDV